MAEVTQERAPSEQRRPASPGDRPEAAAALHHRRHPGRRRLRADRQGGRRGRRAALAAVPHRLRGGGADRVLAMLELVGKYPQAAGAALYTNKAFGMPVRHLHGRVRGDVLRHHVGEHRGPGVRRRLPRRSSSTLPVVAGRAAVPHRARGGQLPRRVGESVKANVVLTLVEVTGLLVIIAIGVWRSCPVTASRPGSPRSTSGDDGVVLGAARRRRARVLRPGRLRGLGQHGRGGPRPEPQLPARPVRRPGDHRRSIYILVALTSSLLVDAGDAGEVQRPAARGGQGRRRSTFPPKLFALIALVAVTNTALINMLMASRLVYGMSREGIVPGRPRPGAPEPPYAVGRDHLHHACSASAWSPRARSRTSATPPRCSCCASSRW